MYVGMYLELIRFFMWRKERGVLGRGACESNFNFFLAFPSFLLFPYEVPNYPFLTTYIQCSVSAPKFPNAATLKQA